MTSTTRITTTSERFWDDVPAEPVPAMITYGEDDINIGKFVYVHYQEPSREELEHYWEHQSYDLAIRINYGSQDGLKELIAQKWPGVPMLYFGCSCCVDDLYEFNECSCGAPIGRHMEGCVSYFPRDSVEGLQADADFKAGNEAGYYGRRCPPGKSFAWKQGYHLSRNSWWKRRFDHGGRRPRR